MRNKLSQHRIGTPRSKVSGGMVAPEVDKNRGEVFGNRLQRSMGASCLAAIISFAAFEQGLAADATNPVIPRETSTIPANGDLNPYGVAFVPDGFPATTAVAPGDVLVSNFNSKSNTQGTGITIVSISPDGTQSLFFQGTPPLGLTTALNVLKRGVVIVGNVPNKANVAQAGSLIVLDNKGSELTGSPLVDPTFLDGPWDSTVIDKGDSAIVFVSCVLNGTVTRLELTFSGNTVAVKSKVKIAEGYKFGPNKAAFVVGPTGLAYDSESGTLYVASTKDNEIFAVADAAKISTANGPGTVIFSGTHLHGPLGLVLAPNGDLISSQGDAIKPSKDPAQQSEIVEFTKGQGGQPGTFVSQFSIDSAAGSAFGIAIQRKKGAVTFAAVDDTMNALTVYDLAEK
ncbi:MAG: hypothetical protein JOZ31_14475 [Verrucomicrobia bacterium]|nr:hypothetical protein [Verrucomicrobiota bacterium]MBV8482864.1 hypothetical protein [Verrucomicrobiota bacterium]